MDLNVVYIKRQLCIEFFSSYRWPWTLGFTSPNIQKAKLMPYQTANVSFERIHAISLTIPMEAHTFSHSYGCPKEN
jgi:hypothetical protein